MSIWSVLHYYSIDINSISIFNEECFELKDENYLDNFYNGLHGAWRKFAKMMVQHITLYIISSMYRVIQNDSSKSKCQWNEYYLWQRYK